MSNTDSFIEEVSEEVRRDHLYGLMRKWGWLAVLSVLVLVGGAAWTEYTRSQETARAQTFGDAVVTALQQDDTPAALEALPADGEMQNLLKQLLVAGNEAANGDPAQAAATLQSLADDPNLPPVYRQLALLKAQMAGGTGDAAADTRILEELATPGAAFRPLAMEQQALRLIEAGDAEGAIVVLRSITEEPSVTDGLRRRAMQVIVALGGSLDPA